MRDGAEYALVLQETSHYVHVDLEVQSFNVLTSGVIQFVEQHGHQVSLNRLG